MDRSPSGMKLWSRVLSTLKTKESGRVSDSHPKQLRVKSVTPATPRRGLDRKRPDIGGSLTNTCTCEKPVSPDWSVALSSNVYVEPMVSLPISMVATGLTSDRSTSLSATSAMTIDHATDATAPESRDRRWCEATLPLFMLGVATADDAEAGWAAAAVALAAVWALSVSVMATATVEVMDPTSWPKSSPGLTMSRPEAPKASVLPARMATEGGEPGTTCTCIDVDARRRSADQRLATPSRRVRV
jgi:hypothetical protein